MPASLSPRELAGTRGPATEKGKRAEMDVVYATQRALLDLYGPPAVIVNAEGDILYISARTGKYLEPASGKVNMNVFAMAREGLREPLGVALHNAAERGAPFTSKGVKVRSNGGWTTVNLIVRPLAERDALRDLLLVVFEETTAPGETATALRWRRPPVRPASWKRNSAARASASRARSRRCRPPTEELRSANEELQSSNEELQSTNEELNSSKEELQSLNEEMQTVNAELQTKMEELAQSNSDMKNLLNGIEIATIFLDNDLGVKRFTPDAARIVNLAPSDVGRPLAHFTTKLKYGRLVHDAREVLEKLVPKTAEVEAGDGRWYHLRVLPYRTEDNAIDGVAMTFADITALKRLEASLQQQKAEAQAARDYAENIIATIREPLVVLDGQLRIVSASRSFYETFHVTPAVTEGRLLDQIGRRQWEIPALRQLLEEVLSKDAQFRGFPRGARFSRHRTQGSAVQRPAHGRPKTGSRADPVGHGRHYATAGKTAHQVKL